MEKRKAILFFIIIASFALAGFGRKEVRLLDGGKLIDLSRAIGLARPGGRAGDTEGKTGVSPDSIKSDDEGASGKGAADDSTNPMARNIVIRIRGEEIYYSYGSSIQDKISETQLENRIRTDFSSGGRVILMDDFAEAHAYRNVCSVLDKLKSETGLTYEEGQPAVGE